MTMTLCTLLWPKGRTAEQAHVNTVENQFKVKKYTHITKYTQYEKLKHKKHKSQQLESNINRPKDTAGLLSISMRRLILMETVGYKRLVLFVREVEQGEEEMSRRVRRRWWETGRRATNGLKTILTAGLVYLPMRKISNHRHIAHKKQEKYMQRDTEKLTFFETFHPEAFKQKATVPTEEQAKG